METPRPRFQLSLRTVLVTLLVGLLLATVGAIGGLAFVTRGESLGEQLAERLRYQQGLAWLSYSDHQTGRFVGAWRRADGTIILNRSSPDVDGGRPSEVVIGLDGRRVPYER